MQRENNYSDYAMSHKVDEIDINIPVFFIANNINTICRIQAYTVCFFRLLQEGPCHDRK